MIYNQYTAFTQSKQIKILIITLIILMAMATNMKLSFMAKQTKDPSISLMKWTLTLMMLCQQ